MFSFGGVDEPNSLQAVFEPFGPVHAADGDGLLDKRLSFEGKDDVELGPALEQSFGDQRVSATG